MWPPASKITMKRIFQLYPEDSNMIYVLLEQCYSFKINTPDRRKLKCLWFIKRHNWQISLKNILLT